MRRPLMRYAALSVAIPVFLGACRAQPRLDPEEAAQARRTIYAWLECEECEEGELQAVVALGDTAIPSLVASLEEGPSPASQELLRRQLAESYRKLQEYAQTHPESRLDLGEEGYIDMYMENYVALYRVRSATALGAIGGTESREALERALEKPLRDDVRTVVRNSLQQLQER